MALTLECCAAEWQSSLGAHARGRGLGAKSPGVPLSSLVLIVRAGGLRLSSRHPSRVWLHWPSTGRALARPRSAQRTGNPSAKRARAGGGNHAAVAEKTVAAERTRLAITGRSWSAERTEVLPESPCVMRNGSCPWRSSALPLRRTKRSYCARRVVDRAGQPSSATPTWTSRVVTPRKAQMMRQSEWCGAARIGVVDKSRRA